MRGYVGADQRQVHFRKAGTEGPWLLLFHESPQSSNVFERALPHLGQRMRVIAFDTPGYGMSDPPEHPLEIADYAAILLAAADELGVGSFAVAGQHTGSSLAVEVARLAGPERVTHAVLSGMTLFDGATRQRYIDGWAPDLPFESDGAHLAELWQRYLRLWEEPPELVNLAVTNIGAIFERYNWAYNAAFRHDPASSLASSSYPLLLLTAERDLLVAGDDLALALRPDATLVRLTNTTGQLPWRVPETWARIVTDFIAGKDIPEAVGS